MPILGVAGSDRGDGGMAVRGPFPGSHSPTMRETTVRTARLAVALAAVTALAAAPASAQDQTITYSGNLAELNDSGASGRARAVLDRAAGDVVVRVEVEGLAAGLPHAQHLHGDLHESSHCPGPHDDLDGDGFVGAVESLPNDGEILLSLTTEGDTSPASALDVTRYPTEGTVSYERTFTIEARVAEELGNLHVVVHGVDVNDNGEYDFDIGGSDYDESLPLEATLPALCGTLAASAAGGVQAGAGGASHRDATGSTLPGIVAVGLLALAGAALASRRRPTDG